MKNSGKQANMNCLNFSLFSVLMLHFQSFINGAEPPLCKFPNYKTAQTDMAEMHKRIQPLLGLRYVAKDSNPDPDSYSYHIGICTNAVVDNEFGPNVGVVQNKVVKTAGQKNTWIIGYYNNSQLIRGTDWVILEYQGGEPYNSHCDGESRKSRIMITCDKTVKTGEEQITVFEEETDKNTDCYYLFEMATSVVCEKEPLVTVSLSVGSILIIVFIVVVFLYLLLGFLYNRLLLGAKGKEQIPNYTFWQDFGNLQADGCNFVCRSGGKSSSKEYKGVGDDMLQEEDERDDHLLPM